MTAPGSSLMISVKLTTGCDRTLLRYSNACIGFHIIVQLNLSTTATLGTEVSGHYGEVGMQHDTTFGGNG